MKKGPSASCSRKTCVFSMGSSPRCASFAPPPRSSSSRSGSMPSCSAANAFSPRRRAFAGFPLWPMSATPNPRGSACAFVTRGRQRCRVSPWVGRCCIPWSRPWPGAPIECCSLPRAIAMRSFTKAMCARAIVPNGVDSEYWRRRNRERGRATILFTGAMHYRPNADAALLLAREIFPLVRREIPDARLVLVGRDPSEELCAAGNSPGIQVTGLVDDVRPYLEEATVFAAPLRFASGIQNKVLEAMSMEIPVVATSAAADGLYAEGGEKPPLTVRDQPAEIAQALVRRIQEESRAPFEEARRFVEQHFSWRTHARRVESILESAAVPFKQSAPRSRERAPIERP